mmetsp:Transcript_171165/g.548650  ORF Transcript_171165/g.548650 Transcript_171165/m.548650 type:complete len:202 (-) Transcript_171165:713-1318(-)
MLQPRRDLGDGVPVALVCDDPERICGRAAHLGIRILELRSHCSDGVPVALAGNGFESLDSRQVDQTGGDRGDRMLVALLCDDLQGLDGRPPNFGSGVLKPRAHGHDGMFAAQLRDHLEGIDDCSSHLGTRIFQPLAQCGDGLPVALLSDVPQHLDRSKPDAVPLVAEAGVHGGDRPPIHLTFADADKTPDGSQGRFAKVSL